MASLDRIFSAIADFTKTMGTLHIDFLNIVRRDIERFTEMTNNLQSQQNWQAWTVIGLSSVGASLAIVGALIPKGSDAASNALNNPRLSANDGIRDAASKALKWIESCLKDNNFLKTTCKSASQFFNGITPAANIWYQGKTTGIESKRELVRLCFQEEQQEKSRFTQDSERAQQAALSILQAKSK